MSVQNKNQEISKNLKQIQIISKQFNKYKKISNNLKFFVNGSTRRIGAMFAVEARTGGRSQKT
jgi:hypothetical protein